MRLGGFFQEHNASIIDVRSSGSTGRHNSQFYEHNFPKPKHHTDEGHGFKTR